MVCTHLDASRTSNQHFPVISDGFPRFWEPSPAGLPSKLERVSEPARSEDLEDFDRILMNFPRIWSSAGAEPSSAPKTLKNHGNRREMLIGGTKCIQMDANHCKTLFCTSLKWFPSLPCPFCKLSMIFHKNLTGNHRIPSLQAFRILTQGLPNTEFMAKLRKLRKLRKRKLRKLRK